MAATKYPLSMRLLHWTMAALILGQFGLGLYMTGLDDSPSKLQPYDLHKSFGVVLLGLVVVRLLVRLGSSKPDTPVGIAKWERIVARSGHFLLYTGMLLVPVLGYLAASASPTGEGQWFFGLRLPDAPIEQSEELSEDLFGVHGSLAFTLIAVVIVHVAAVLRHRFFDKPENDVLNRML